MRGDGEQERAHRLCWSPIDFCWSPIEIQCVVRVVRVDGEHERCIVFQWDSSKSLWAHREYIAQQKSMAVRVVRVDGEHERCIVFQWDSSKSLWDSSKVYGLIENT